MRIRAFVIFMAILLLAQGCNDAQKRQLIDFGSAVAVEYFTDDSSVTQSSVLNQGSHLKPNASATTMTTNSLESQKSLMVQESFSNVTVSGRPITPMVPVPDAYPMSTQRKMQAVQHWGALAEIVASIIKEKFFENFLENQHSIYIAPAGITPFDKGFHELLITRLVEKEVPVSNNYKNPLVLSFDTQIVSYKRSPFEAGELTIKLPKKEVMVTLSLMFKGVYVMRHSSVYYINDPEWWHYAQRSEVQEPGVARYTLVDK